MSKAKELSELGDAVTVDSGNVGIGVSPSSNLHIGASGNDAKRELRIDGTNGSGQTFGFITEADGENGRVSFKVGQGGATPTQKLMIHPDGGITFGTDTASANALDDYEEGSWTPAIEGLTSNPSISYSTRTGWYTKVGNTVNIWCWIHINTFSGGSGVAVITDLPFTASSGTGKLNFGTTYANNVLWGSGAATQIVSYIPVGGTYIRLQGMQNNVAGSDVQVTNFAANDQIGIHVAYTV